jgi:AcrR family transcriptional regulator
MPRGSFCAASGHWGSGGAQALSLNAVAVGLGISGPALYRYYRNWDALLTDLIIDAYDDLAAAVAPATTTAAFADAYRAWAMAQPHRYRLLFGPPLPGYDAHARPLVDASQRAMDELLRCLATDDPAEVAGLDVAELRAWMRARGIDVPAQHAGRALAVWSRLHGLVSLEINGNFASVGVDPHALYVDAVER